MCRSFPFARIIFALSLLGTCRAFATTSGTALPLDQYQAGTEQTTPVVDGGFENNTKWTSVTSGEPTRATPYQPPTPSSTVGSFAMQALVGAPDTTTDSLRHGDTFTFDPAEDYVLSAYMWSNGATGHIPFPIGDTAEVRLDNGSNTFSIILASQDGAAGAYFVYATFSGSLLTGDVQLDALGDELPAFLQETSRPSPYAQIDNVAITLASQFSPPTAIPEPSSAAAVLAAGLLLRRRPFRAASGCFPK